MEVEDQWKLQLVEDLDSLNPAQRLRPELAEDLDSLKPVLPPNRVEDLDSLKLDQERSQPREPELAEDLDSLKPVQPPNLVEDLDSLKLDQEGVPAHTPFPQVRIRMVGQPLEPKGDFHDKFADLTGSNAPGVHGPIPPSELRIPTIG